MEILAVVDDLFLSSKITGPLEANGHSVKIIPDPAAALSHAESRHPALVIIDLGLQNGDPFEMIRLLKTNGSTPVLAYTRHTDLEGQRKAGELGCDKVVVRSEFFDNINVIVGNIALK